MAHCYSSSTTDNNHTIKHPNGVMASWVFPNYPTIFHRYQSRQSSKSHNESKQRILNLFSARCDAFTWPSRSACHPRPRLFFRGVRFRRSKVVVALHVPSKKVSAVPWTCSPFLRGFDVRWRSRCAFLELFWRRRRPVRDRRRNWWCWTPWGGRAPGTRTRRRSSRCWAEVRVDWFGWFSCEFVRWIFFGLGVEEVCVEWELTRMHTLLTRRYWLYCAMTFSIEFKQV